MRSDGRDPVSGRAQRTRTTGGGDIPQFQKGLMSQQVAVEKLSWTPGNSVHISTCGRRLRCQNGTERLGRQSYSG